MRLIQSMELRVPQKKRRPWQPRNRRNRFSRWWSQKTGSLSESASGFSRLALMSQCLSLILPMPLIKTESEPIASDLLGRKCCLWRWNISTYLDTKWWHTWAIVYRSTWLYMLHVLDTSLCCNTCVGGRLHPKDHHNHVHWSPPCLTTSLANLVHLVGSAWRDLCGKSFLYNQT